MSDYEKMSEEMNEMKKNSIMKAEIAQPEGNTQEPRNSGNLTLAKVMGIIFIVIGAIGFIGILLTFDWDTYFAIKDRTSTYATEIMLLKSELTTTLIVAGATLIGNLAVGSVLLSLDTIIQLLRGLVNARVNG